MIKLPAKHILTKLEERENFQNVLLEWYDQAQRQLPWRTDPSLYKTVVSEFMLQQTRVSTVLPYFKNWLEKFPDFHALAQAKEEEVLKGWEGLGYYSRARNLHKLARIVSSWKLIPTDLQSWLSLPGVGPYIASAVTSISFGQPQAVCDGNVVRVLSRIFAHGESFKDGSSAQKKMSSLAAQILNHQRPGDYNQAVMELGATICHRKSPDCNSCPVASFCKGAKEQKSENYPKFKRKKIKQKIIKRFFIESNRGIVLWVNNKESKKLAGICEMPSKIPKELIISKGKNQCIGIIKRTIGNTKYIEKIFHLRILFADEKLIQTGYKWMMEKEIRETTISAPHRKWITSELAKKKVKN